MDDETPYGFQPLIIPLVCGACGDEIPEGGAFGYCEHHGCDERICSHCWDTGDGVCSEHGG